MSEFQNQINRNKNAGANMSQWRHYFNWKKSFKPEANSMVDRQPWITFDAIDVLKKHINHESRVFEFGGGGSTLFFLDRVAEVITAEHNPEWFKNLTEAITNDEKRKWKGMLMEAEQGRVEENPDASEPNHYYTTDENYLQSHFRSYAQSINQFADEYFDVVLVDGRSRVSCLIHGLDKVKLGGLLVLDNSDREYYLDKISGLILAKYSPLVTNQGASPYAVPFTRTTIWRRIR